MQTAEEYYLEFRRLIHHSVQKRAKGISYNRIAFWNINLFLLVAGLSSFFMIPLREKSYFLFLVAAYILAVFIVNVPEYFYHQEKRRGRYLRKHYPAVYRAIPRLKEKGEHTSFDAPPLHIDGKTYFLVTYYFRQPWWERRLWVQLSGWAVLDEQGNVIQDAELFAKAFLTMGYADFGAVETQKRKEGERRELRFALKKYLPRLERFFRKRERFEKHGMMEAWNYVTQAFPSLYQMVKDALEFYDVNDKIMEAIGYSFGYEFWYEDAVHAEKIYRAFGQYMNLKYTRLNVNTQFHILKTSAEMTHRFSPGRYVLKLGWETLYQVYNLTRYALFKGIPSEFEWQAYVNRLEVARKKGFRVIERAPLPEGYPFKDVMYHDEYWCGKRGELGM